VHGGAEGLEKDFRANPGKYISADPNELNVLFHPSSLYEKLKWNIMHIKMPTCDAFGTDLIQKFPGHENRVCTHNMSIFNENSEAYAQAQAAYEAGLALSLEVRKQIWEFKSAIDEGFASLYDDDESPAVEEFYTVENLDQIKPFLLEDKKVNKLYKWAVLKYDGDEGVMKKMKQYANNSSNFGEEGVALGREVTKQTWALKAAIDKAFMPLSLLDDDESLTVDEIYTVDNLNQIKPILTDDEKLNKLYKWAELKYEGDDGIMEKMKHYARLSKMRSQTWALKAAIDKAFMPLSLLDDDESLTVDEIYTVDNLNQIKPILTDDEKLNKLYKWAELKYEGDDGIMEKMKHYARLSKMRSQFKAGRRPGHIVEKSKGRFVSICQSLQMFTLLLETNSFNIYFVDGFNIIYTDQ